MPVDASQILISIASSMIVSAATVTVAMLSRPKTKADAKAAEGTATEAITRSAATLADTLTERMQELERRDKERGTVMEKQARRLRELECQVGRIPGMERQIAELTTRLKEREQELDRACEQMGRMRSVIEGQDNALAASLAELRRVRECADADEAPEAEMEG